MSQYIAFVVAKDGTPLMPTHNPKKVRKLLKEGKAAVCGYTPFTIKLTYDSEKNVQPVEIGVDSGAVHIGVSVKSEKHEYLSLQADLLSGVKTDEKSMHDKKRMYRRTRRNRLRHRAPRFDNRRKGEGWFAPSIRNKIDRHVDIIKKICGIVPVSHVTIECGQFDTQVLNAINAGKPIPEGIEYQHGERYGFDTLREALFARDHYTCQVCKRNIFENKNLILCVHHALFWKGDHTDRLNSLLTVCTKCHTPKNHQPGEKLWGLEVNSKPLNGAAFMNTAKWEIYKNVNSFVPCSITYGAATKRVRLDRNIAKSYVNDAYCIGGFFPKHRAEMIHIEKKRRNNRVLSKFYDAKIIDIRTGELSTGKKLGCNRTKRKEPRRSEKNERIYRGQKKSTGQYRIRKQRYPIQPGDILLYKGEKVRTTGCHSKGKVCMINGKSVAISKVKVMAHANGWKRII